MLFCIVAGLAFNLPGVTVAPLPESPCLDTEVSTNIAFNLHRSDVKELNLHMAFVGTASNNVQVALGRDVNGDGTLEYEETGIVYGWRSGRLFIENVPDRNRLYEESVRSNAAPRHLRVAMKMTDEYAPRTFAATNENGAVFMDLSARVPDGLYRPEWNLMRVTRRGTDVPAEWIDCRIGYRSFYVLLR